MAQPAPKAGPLHLHPIRSSAECSALGCRAAPAWAMSPTDHGQGAQESFSLACRYVHSFEARWRSVVAKSALGAPSIDHGLFQPPARAPQRAITVMPRAPFGTSSWLTSARINPAPPAAARQSRVIAPKSPAGPDAAAAHSADRC